MKNLTTFCITTFISLSSISAAANDECINKYRKNFFKKNAKYEKANERYSRKIKNWRDRQFAFASFGATLNNDPAPTSPKKADFKLYEAGIIKSYEMNLTASMANQPKFFKSLYKEAKKIDTNMNPQLVQDQLKTLMNDGKFCKSQLFGIFEKFSKEDEVKEMVIEGLKVSLIAEVNSSHVNDETLSKQERLDEEQARTPSTDTSSGSGDQ
jgi:hypothetical protein